jgi:hypothetical protein
LRRDVDTQWCCLPSGRRRGRHLCRLPPPKHSEPFCSA